MSRELFATQTEWEPYVGYSRAVRVGDHVFVSGTVATNENGELVAPGDPYAQTIQVLENLKRALERAARRGVDVRLLLPSHSDSAPALAAQQSHYSDLLEAGVKIYERADGILHSKTVVVDGVWSIVGSSNFDHRSVLFNDEVDAVVISAATGAQLQQYFQRDLEHATGIDLATWKQRPLAHKLREHFWRLWEQLL